MAVIYLRSTDGSDSDDGSTWALAKATLAAALTAAGAGGTVYVSQSHTETQASTMTLASPGTSGAVTQAICVDDSAEPPTALATTATVSNTGGYNISFTGHCYVYGVSFSGATSGNYGCAFTNSSVSLGWTFDSCVIKNATTSYQSINIGSATGGNYGGYVKLINSQIYFGSTWQSLKSQSASLVWIGGGLASGSAVPTTLLAGLTGNGSKFMVLDGVDISALGSGKSLVDVSAASSIPVVVKNCKIGGSVSIISGAINAPNQVTVSLDNCDSSDTNYRMEHYKYQGSIKAETSKTRSGGASDGTTPISWNMTSLAGSSFVSPLESPPISIWNETTGSSKTVTVEIAQDSAATTLNDDEIWLEVEYMGTSGYPISSIASDRKANILATAAAQTTSSVTWDNMTTPTKQKLEVSFTPQEKGLFTARVMLAKASTTVYVDPIITVS